MHFFLQALLCVTSALPNIDDNLDLGLLIAQRVWVASFDVDSDVKALAEEYVQSHLNKQPSSGKLVNFHVLHFNIGVLV